jgi:CheY-like chemotaxis protein
MPHKLLLADDSVTIQRVIELTFADEDVEVTAVGDGQLAIERLDMDPPDIILADIDMPKRDGYEVAAYVKSRPKLAHIPVVLLTGAFEPIDQARATAAGSSDVLSKPFEPQMVINRVKELLGRKRHEEPVDAAPAPPPAAPPQPQAPASPQASQPPASQPQPAASATSANRQPADSAQPVSLDDYFDQLDAAFSNLQPAAQQAEDTSQEIDWLGTQAAPVGHKGTGGASTATVPAVEKRHAAEPQVPAVAPPAAAPKPAASEPPAFAPAASVGPAVVKPMPPRGAASAPVSQAAPADKTAAPFASAVTAAPIAPSAPVAPIAAAAPPAAAPLASAPTQPRVPDVEPLVTDTAAVELEPPWAPPAVPHPPAKPAAPVAPAFAPDAASPFAPSSQGASEEKSAFAPGAPVAPGAPAAPGSKPNPFANLAAAKAEADARAAAPVITDEVIEEVVSRVLARLTDKVVRETVSEIVSQTAERLVQEEIERIKAGT